MEKVVIAGSGPAGLSAAIYSARAGLSPLVLEGPVPGGQLTVSSEVENYPGVPGPVSGIELIDRCKQQAKQFGARFQKNSVETTALTNTIATIQTSKGSIETESLIIATGAQARRLPIPSESKFYGRGVSGCAVCDGPFFKNKNVLVIGGGNTAMEDAFFLAKFAQKVSIVHRREYLRAEAIQIERVKKNKSIEWLIPWVVLDIKGSGMVSGAVLKNTRTGEHREIQCDGIFVAIGHDPETAVFKNIVQVDGQGFIEVHNGSTQTMTPGVFACGDVRDPVYKQAIVAAAYGCMAALDVIKYLERRK